MRIMVFGHSGSGKSTFSKTLANHYTIPVLHIDAIHFSEGWVERDKNVRNQELSDFIENRNDWVIDGNYTQAHFERRCAVANQIFFFDFNRFVCLKNVLLRYWRFKGKTRDSIAEGCNEKMDFAFIWWILHLGRTRKRLAKFKQVIKDYPNKVIVFKNRKQVQRYIQKQAMILVDL